MGIYCEINLYKPSDGAFKPGSPVSGVIKYAVNEETTFNKITISIKGHGLLIMKDRHRRRNGAKHNVHTTTIFRRAETYVDVDNIINPIKSDDKEYILPVGAYETQFSFMLPHDIPPTFKYHGMAGRYRVDCNISYYIRIKFDQPGFFSFAKRFKKDITVVSGITPRLPMTPTICGEKKTLTQLFSSKHSVVDIKATIQNCVIKPGGKLDIDYEVLNDTNVTVKSIKTKLVEQYTFSTGGRVARHYENIPNTDTKTGSLKSGETKVLDVEICTPSNLFSLENSKLVVRDYVVSIKVELPFPHRDAELLIPVQIGDTIGEDIAIGEDLAIGGEAPPSYWEAMGEQRKGDDDFGDEKGD